MRSRGTFGGGGERAEEEEEDERGEEHHDDDDDDDDVDAPSHSRILFTSPRSHGNTTHSSTVSTKKFGSNLLHGFLKITAVVTFVGVSRPRNSVTVCMVSPP